MSRTASSIDWLDYVQTPQSIPIHTDTPADFSNSAVVIWNSCSTYKTTRHVHRLLLCTRIDDYVSSARRITAGIPPGSVSGTLLFSVYAHDVSGSLEPT